MKKLYFIQYSGYDFTLENKIRSLGRFYVVTNGWVVESTMRAKDIYEYLTHHNPAIEIIILGVDRNDYWGRYTQEFWDLLK